MVKVSQKVIFKNVNYRGEIPPSGFLANPQQLPIFEKIKFLMERDFSGYIDQFGFPCIDVYISHDENPRKKVKAVIDTGAAHCLMKPDLIKQMGLRQLKASTFIHPQDGVQPTGYYSVNVFIDIYNTDGCALLQNIIIGEIHATDYPAELILGVSFLNYAHFIYDGINKDFRLKFSLD